MAASVDYYFLGKGILSFKPEGGPDYIDLGNSPKFETEPTNETLEHFSSRAGVKKQDRKVILSQALALNLTLEEFNPFNLGLAFGSDVSTVDGHRVVKIGSKAEVKGAIRLVGTNEVGSKFQHDYPEVTLRNDGAVAFIGEDWGQLNLVGDVLYQEDDGNFGTVTEIAQEGETVTE